MAPRPSVKEETITLMYSMIQHSAFVPGADPWGRGGLGGQDPPPLPFWETQNFIKRDKTLRAGVLVVNSLPDPPFGNHVTAPVY